ncbi:male accessory gland serine protease inhibitor-like [Cochliomyia hominivorax]
MKFVTISALLLVIFATFATAQWQNCHGRGWPGSCVPNPSSGFGGLRCPSAVTVWAYDRRSRQCRPLVYMGCGGNNNRWCTRGACERSCRR